MDSTTGFRILDLLPANYDGDLRCNIRNLELGTCEPYEALSYVWGDQLNLEPIQVAGATVKITKSLQAALRRLRKPNVIRPLWVDQLCINQLDSRDKSRQVSIMRQIYKNCSRCLIWLGELPYTLAVSDAEGAFDFICMCAGQWGDSKFIPPGLSTPDRLARAHGAFKALVLDGNPWWSRIWTVQEVVLPSNALVIWGPLCLPWATFKQAARRLCSGLFPRLHYPILDTFHDIVNNFTGPVRGLEIAEAGESPLNILQRWRHRKATDPRDKAFALMGMFSHTPIPGVQICDYDMSVVNLYKKVTAGLIQSEQGLRPLVGLRPNSIPDLPSWAIDLSQTPCDNTPHWWWNHSHRYKKFAADCGEDLQFTPPLHEGSLLSLRGISVDTAQEVGSPLRGDGPESISNKQIIESTKIWQQLMERSLGDRKYPSGETPADVFWRTMMGDLLMQEFPLRRANDNDARRAALQFHGGSPSNKLICNSVRMMIAGQTFFVTERGYVGIGPPNLAEGDEVWVLSGGKVPFILRPSTGDESPRSSATPLFTLIGDAFVYGIMDGEAIALHKGGPQAVYLH
ncbi:HET-domain-containing protein [Colletotrichum asianum]|uniref:Heterokaryon incompatibility protein n=1 Tax=Colletotrichum asianum TaxID=702518 RepID=A0A8H3ZWH8_9PEZI|nr:heterokaryon incompatibility protein [Colletotrichum asianum]